MDAAFLDQQTQVLQRELNELRAGETEREQAAATVELDQTRQGRLSRMDALQAQAIARSGQRRAQQRQRAIVLALRKLEQGDYGDCETCGELISEGRLQVDPAARVCIECAEAGHG